MSRLIDADRLLKRTKFYNLPNGNRAIDEIDILHAPTVNAIPLDKVKQTREEIKNIKKLDFLDIVGLLGSNNDEFETSKKFAIAILDKLIEEDNNTSNS